MTKGVIECIIIKSSVERAKEHGKRSVRVEKKLKTFSKNFKKSLDKLKTM